MNHRIESKTCTCALALLASCFLWPPVLAQAQVLQASADGFITLGGGTFSANATSTNCTGICEGKPVVCTGDSECTFDCILPDLSCPDNPPGVTTVIDEITTNDTGGGSLCALVANFGPFHMFSWYSLTEMPGSTFFPKIFASATKDGSTSTNNWQTTTPVEISPGIVRMQSVCVSAGPGSPPEYGPIHFFNAMAWSPDFSGTRADNAPPIESGSLASSASLGSDAGAEVRLESVVEQVRPGVYRYDYIFENTSGESVTIVWDSANLTRTLGPSEGITVTTRSAYPAKESQGYAHVRHADGEPIADMVSMALVPTQSIPWAPDRRKPDLPD